MAEPSAPASIDTTDRQLRLRMTGAPDKIDQFVELMRPLGLVEVSRTGVAAMPRGKDRCDAGAYRKHALTSP